MSAKENTGEWGFLGCYKRLNLRMAGLTFLKQIPKAKNFIRADYFFNNFNITTWFFKIRSSVF